MEWGVGGAGGEVRGELRAGARRHPARRLQAFRGGDRYPQGSGCGPHGRGWGRDGARRFSLLPIDLPPEEA
eukprot:10560781-Lingulodinium_polyedra.AAC.1